MPTDRSGAGSPRSLAFLNEPVFANQREARRYLFGLGLVSLSLVAIVLDTLVGLKETLALVLVLGPGIAGMVLLNLQYRSLSRRIVPESGWRAALRRAHIEIFVLPWRIWSPRAIVAAITRNSQPRTRCQDEP